MIHDPRIWEAVDELPPDRFLRWDDNPFSFTQNHRCLGEWTALELIKRSSTFLAGRVTYDVPEQDLGIDFSRPPARPCSRFVIRNVRARA